MRINDSNMVALLEKLREATINDKLLWEKEKDTTFSASGQIFFKTSFTLPDRSDKIFVQVPVLDRFGHLYIRLKSENTGEEILYPGTRNPSQDFVGAKTQLVREIDSYILKMEEIAEKGPDSKMLEKLSKFLPSLDLER